MKLRLKIFWGKISLVMRVSGFAAFFSFVISILIELFFDQYPKLQASTFSIAIGIFTSSLVAFFVDWSNGRASSKKNQHVKEIVLRPYALKISRAIMEFYAGGDRSIDYIPYHFDHFLWSIDNRIIPMYEMCDEILEKYNALLEKDEIDVLNQLKLSARSFAVYKNESWKNDADKYSKIMESIYGEEFYKSKSENAAYSESLKQQAKKYIDAHKKDLSELKQICVNLQDTMPQIFEHKK